MTAIPSENRLLLRATDLEDLKVIAACLQDALLPVQDACYLPSEQSFVLVVNRFRWEAEAGDNPDQPGALHERVLCGVRFEGVKRVASRGIERSKRTLPLELLTLAAGIGPEPDTFDLRLIFAGGGAIRLEVDRILCHLEDLDEAWPTRWRPNHPIETA